MVTEKTTFIGNPMEQFINLAKSTSGPALLDLIKQILEAPGMYVFAEFLDMESIIQLKIAHANYVNTLNLFAYGTYKEYLENRSNFLELTPNQIKKLQHLTIVTLATKSKHISYTDLLQELNVTNVRDLEDLIIEAVYADIINGKLDQKNSLLEVDHAIGRDIRPADIDVIVNCLQEWCSACDGVLSCVESQIMRANTERNRCVTRKADIENEINNIKKTLKTHLQDRLDGSDDAMATDCREASISGSDKSKKVSKMKGLKLDR